MNRFYLISVIFSIGFCKASNPNIPKEFITQPQVMPRKEYERIMKKHLASQGLNEYGVKIAKPIEPESSSSSKGKKKQSSWLNFKGKQENQDKSHKERYYESRPVQSTSYQRLRPYDDSSTTWDQIVRKYLNEHDENIITNAHQQLQDKKRSEVTVLIHQYGNEKTDMMLDDVDRKKHKEAIKEILAAHQANQKYRNMHRFDDNDQEYN